MNAPTILSSTCLAVGLLLGLADSVRAQEFEPKFFPTLHVPRTTEPIRIDGELSDNGWKRAARATGFAEVNPGDQTRPPVDSEAWVTYDDVNLYVALIAQDDPEDIRVSVSDRDDIFRDDYFGIMLDTYGDQRWGYELFVNPLGIQGDLRMQSNGGEDGSFDIIWSSEGQITETGYQVEIAIPFASLRFPDTPQQEWRVNFWRDHQRDVRRKYAWAAQDRDNPCFMCQWGTLEGIRDIKPTQNVEFIASAVGTQAGELTDFDDPSSSFDTEDPDGTASLNVRYGITSSASAELAINPDFSQIESDAGQIDVNTTFALFFPERRPFFQEGSDLYNTWVNAIYTRSINDPDVAGKLTGQFGRTSMIYTYAQDNQSPMFLPLEEESETLLLDNSVSNILRVRRSLKEESYVGALFTDRRLEGEGSGTTYGADALFRFFRNYRLELQAVASRTVEPNDSTLTDGVEQTFDGGKHTLAFDGESFNGHAVYASLERSARLWDFDFDYWEYSPTFRSDNGFTTRNDYRQTSFWTGLDFQPNGKWLLEWEPSVSLGRIWNHDNRFKDEWLRPNLWLRLRGQTFVNFQYLVSKERFGPQTFPGIRVFSFDFDTRFTEMVGGGFDFRLGRGIFRDLDDPELANQRFASFYVNVKPMRNFEIETDFDFAEMESRTTSDILFSGYIVRNRFTFNFTREWFLRLVVQYNDFGERLDIEPLLTYRINPFTVFYVGSNSGYENITATNEDDQVVERDWRNSSRQFFAKIQYLWRI